MKTHEYQGRALLEAYGIAVPRGVLACTAGEAGAAAAEWGGKAVIKGQVLTGGRGKAGAIRVVSSQEEAESAAREILGMEVKGFVVEKVLVTERLDIRGEYYMGLTIDREARSVVLIVSPAGGMDIEEIAARSAEKIRYFAIDDDAEAVERGLSELFADGGLWEQAVGIARNMYRLFREQDCSLVEINPLAETAKGRLVAADAKIVFDDNALWRHPDVEMLSNPEEYTADEREAGEAGLSFVSLSGAIGCMVNGAGLAMATMDGIKLAGDRAANFLDVGGSSNPQKVLDAMRILVRNERLKAILVNIFGGITRCDDVAAGIVQARDELEIDVPVVIRLIGTNEEKGREILSEAGLIAMRGMREAIEKVVECAQGGAES